MYDVVIRFLARCFVAGPQIQLRAQTFADFATALGDDAFLPKQILEVGPGGNAVSRLAVGSSKGDWIVQVTGESVDVQYSPVMGDSPIGFEAFCGRAGEHLGAALDFLDAKAYRVAAVQEGLLKELSAEAMARTANRLLTGPAPFDSVTPFEWDWRMAVEVVRRFGAIDETTNTIAIVKRVEATAGGLRLDRLLVSADINTTPKRADPRYNSLEIRAFLAESVGWHAKLSDDLLAFIQVS